MPRLHPLCLHFFRVGVIRTSSGDLVFFVNGVSQSVAASELPDKVWAVIDLYGKCAQVTLTTDNCAQEARILSNDLTNEATAAAAAHNHVNQISSGNSAQNNITNSNIAAMMSEVEVTANEGIRMSSSQQGFFPNNNKLRFHDRKGTLIKLSNNNRTSERRRPYDEFNNGVVMTHRPLRDNELFEIRIDRLVDKWSGSIEVGITTHNPGTLDFPATMTNQKSGTMMMSGCGILTNGKGTRREYGDFNLDELHEGDRIGMMRKANGNLHFYINGLDQGVAATRVPMQMWGVVDLYGMTVKVTIVDRDERDEQNLITRRNVNAMREHVIEDNRLLFHHSCGSHAAVINGGVTAHRPNANDDFNFGVVLTSRPLKPNEVFEVRLDRMVTKWAGSIEIGVTTHNPGELEFPSTMTNIRSGTWMMTGNGVMHNGTTVIEDYGQNLDKLKVGDRVAVVRKENGTVHFFVNSEDQGPAATNVPDRVYGVIDLYGQAAQATIIDLSDYRSPDMMESDATTIYSGILETGCNDLKFHHLHGRNARINNNGATASRPNALGEFNDAIIMSNRPLRDGELFEIVIERIVERWSGSIEAGVTLIRPEDLEFPNTMTDIDYDTWMLSGSAVMQDGQTIRNGYTCDLDSLSVGSRLGMMRHTDGSLRYTINGEDQGIACENIPSNVYAVIDLYGQCAQVSVVHHLGLGTGPSVNLVQSHHRLIHENNSLASSQVMESSHISLPLLGTEVVHRFNPAWCSQGVEVSNNNATVSRGRNSINSAIVLASSPLWQATEEDIFEVRIDEVQKQWAGSMKIGITTQAPTDSSIIKDIKSLPGQVYWLEGSSIKHNSQVVKMNYSITHLDRLVAGDKIAVKRHNSDGSLRFLLNGEDCGIAVAQVPKKLIPWIELYGSTMSVSVVSVSQTAHPSPAGSMLALHNKLPSMNTMMDSLEVVLEHDEETAEKENDGFKVKLEFHDNHGRNIELKNGNTLASRTDSYNQGVIVTNRSLKENEVFEVKLTRLNHRWTSSLMIGALFDSPDRLHLPVTAIGLKKNAIVISGDTLYQNGHKMENLTPNLDKLTTDQTVGIVIDAQRNLRLLINGVDQGVMVKNIPQLCYGIVDLYGQCEEVLLCLDAITIDTSITQDKSNAPLILRPSSLQSSQSCDYLRLCSQFKASLCIPNHYLVTSTNAGICYCLHCIKSRGEESYKKKGDPAKDYATPVNWVRFALKQCRAEQSTESWHTTYHGISKPLFIRKILDHGELVPLSDFGLVPPKMTPKLKESKDDDADKPQLVFSPTLCYFLKMQQSCANFKDDHRKKFKARLAFEVDIHPGSYKIGPPTTVISSSTTTIDAHFKWDETEWLTKEKGNTAIKALLVHLEPIL